MANTKKDWISNWLISSIEADGNSNSKNGEYLISFTNTKQEAISNSKIDKSVPTAEKTANLSKIQKHNVSKKSVFKNKNKIIEESELTKSPVSGTFIIKEWNNKLKNKFIRENSKKENNLNKFTNDEIMLNSVASNYVQITDEAKVKLSKIVNCIGPYECKLCKIVYSDAFELAMHNCPRVVHFEYK